jgi:hypothetical protein
VVALLVATVVLFAFILVQGDVRRRQRAMGQARRYVAALVNRLGEPGALPLNLDPAPAPDRSEGTSSIEPLSREDARLLRASGQRVVAAQTRPVFQVLLPGGRAVVFFADGRFDVEWLSLAKFDELYAAQQAEIRRLAADGPREPAGR